LISLGGGRHPFSIPNNLSDLSLVSATFHNDLEGIHLILLVTKINSNDENSKYCANQAGKTDTLHEFGRDEIRRRVVDLG
jgi:hypothetical protein